jgi:hypothetical protein
MRLLNDQSRCLGSLEESGIYRICDRRQTCARYVQRNAGGERTPITNMICRDGIDLYIQEENNGER